MKCFHLQRDVLSEGDVSRHGEVIELQHVRDVLKPGQKLLNLKNKKHHGAQQTETSSNTSRRGLFSSTQTSGR